MNSNGFVLLSVWITVSISAALSGIVEIHQEGICQGVADPLLLLAAKNVLSGTLATYFMAAVLVLRRQSK